MKSPVWRVVDMVSTNDLLKFKHLGWRFIHLYTTLYPKILHLMSTSSLLNLLSISSIEYIHKNKRMCSFSSTFNMEMFTNTININTYNE